MQKILSNDDHQKLIYTSKYINLNTKSKLEEIGPFWMSSKYLSSLITSFWILHKEINPSFSVPK